MPNLSVELVQLNWSHWPPYRVLMEEASKARARSHRLNCQTEGHREACRLAEPQGLQALSQPAHELPRLAPQLTQEL